MDAHEDHVNAGTPDAALLRGLTEARHTRGQMLRAAGAGLGAVSLSGC